jgi:hypothetical protein
MRLLLVATVPRAARFRNRKAAVASKRRISVGDVFAIPLNDTHVGYGQVVAEQAPAYYMAAFDSIDDGGQASAEAVASGRMVLLGNFFDALLKSGRWRIIGKAPLAPGIPFPAYRVVIDGVTYVESWDWRVRRPATADDLKPLRNRANYAPIILENALRALHGMAPWSDHFDGLRIDDVRAARDVLASASHSVP